MVVHNWFIGLPLSYYDITAIRKLYVTGIFFFMNVADLYYIAFISLHIHSMWETICDAWACWIGWNFGPNSTVYPYSEEYPPPPENWNLGRSWHFDFSVSEYPPPKIEI